MNFVFREMTDAVLEQRLARTPDEGGRRGPRWRAAAVLACGAMDSSVASIEARRRETVAEAIRRVAAGVVRGQGGPRRGLQGVLVAVAAARGRRAGRDAKPCGFCGVLAGEDVVCVARDPVHEGE